MTNKLLLDVLKTFSSISLEELNATMSLMERVDKKYIVSLKDLGRVMKELTQDYFVLSINDNSLFTYDNIYMDTPDFLFFHQHEQGQKSRMKVRTRHYVDSRMAFFECKQKQGSLTRKGRYRIPVGQALAMNDQSQSFFNGVCASLQLPYAEERLEPTMRTLYQRITLCSKNNDERITIDFDLKLQDMTKPGSPLISLPPIAIIESKSTHNKCGSHQILAHMGYKSVSKCSKYCLAVLYTRPEIKSESFKRVMNFIESFKPTRKNIVKKVEKRVAKTVKSLNGLKKDISQPLTLQ